jgi:uncharacterized protein (DUF302 family)
MTYSFNTVLDRPFDTVVGETIDALAQEGFGIITQIDLKATFKAKLGVDFRPYLILGACNPALALEALKLEDKVGTMLPCNVVVQSLADGRTEVAAVDPVASMAAIDNPALKAKAQMVADKLKAAVARL